MKGNYLDFSRNLDGFELLKRIMDFLDGFKQAVLAAFLIADEPLYCEGVLLYRFFQVLEQLG